MNPFSGFLQPQNHRPLEGLATTQDLLRVIQGNKEMAQRKLENEQQNTRANSYLALQQGDQAHRFSAEDQKQVEGLLAEYQQAEDQGDAVRLSRAAQMLKRFGMDVSQKQAPPDLRALTGEQLLPSKQQPLNPRDFTGSDPVDLSQEEFEKRLIAGSADSPATTSGEEPDIAGHLKAVGPLKALNLNTPEEQEAEAAAAPPTDLGDVDSPAFKSSARGEGETTRLNPAQEAQFQAWAKSNGIKDANDPRSHYDYRGYFIESGGAPHRQGDHFPDTFKQHGHETFSEESRYSSGPGDGGHWNGEQFTPAPTLAVPRRLATQVLPTVISKGGKQLYESTGPSGRWGTMVGGVFEPFLQHEDPRISEAAKSAQQLATKLVEVDGVAPKDAIKAGMDYLNNEANRATNIQRSEINRRPRFGGGGGGAPVVAPMKDRKPFNEEMNRTYMQFKSEKLDEQFQGYNAGIGAISSANTASQYDALNRLIQARSGLTVSDKERAIYDNLSGMWNGLLKKFNLLSGGELPSEYRNQIKALMTEARQAVVEEKERRAQAAANFYRAKTRGADPESVEQDANAVADAIRMGAQSATGGGPTGSPAPAAVSEEDLY